MGPPPCGTYFLLHSSLQASPESSLLWGVWILMTSPVAGEAAMPDPHEQAIFELAKFYVEKGLIDCPNSAVAVRLREDFENKRTELAALVGPSFQDRFWQKVLDVTQHPSHPQPPQTIRQRFLAMFVAR